MKEIIQNAKVYAIIGDTASLPQNKTTFVGAPEERLQFSVLRYNRDKVLQSHIHKHRVREIERTQESWIILKGVVQVSIYDEDKVLIATEMLFAGHFYISYRGGHGYQILSKDTIVIENKLGDFVGVEEDKEKF